MRRLEFGIIFGTKADGEMTTEVTSCALARDILEWYVPEEVLAPINHHLMTKGLCEMKTHSEKELRKLPADGKIAYLIKPILKVLQDAGGQLERTQTY